jgi:hypothetical protein
MKNPYRLLVLFSIAVTLFTSCSEGSKLALTKRHYRSGYYVENGSSRAKEIAVTQSKPSAIPTIKPSETATRPATSTAAPVQAQASSSDKMSVEKVHEANRSTPVRTKKHESKTSAVPSSAKAFADKSKTVETALPNAVNPFFAAKKLGQKLSTPVVDDDGARSLLWLIIVIILILWLLGLLFSYGGSLIHLLLVLALILFILWLLRII